MDGSEDRKRLARLIAGPEDCEIEIDSDRGEKERERESLFAGRRRQGQGDEITSGTWRVRENERKGGRRG